MDKTLGLLAAGMLEGYSWGLAARQASAPFRSPDALANAPQLPRLDEMKSAVADLLAKEGQGVTLFEAADKLVDQYQEIEDLREYLIDICVLKLLGELEEEDPEKEEVLDSKQWLEIEEAGSERGSELLNVLVYLKDCKLGGADPGIEDFLYEFLLADEEDFQEELAIYEPLIRNLDLIDGALKVLVQEGNNQREEEMRALFTPLMLFFRDPEPQVGKITLSLLEHSAWPEIHCALFRLLCGFHWAE